MLSLKNSPDVLSVQQVAEILNVSQRSVYKLLEKDLIPHRKIGRIYRISKQELINFLKK